MPISTPTTELQGKHVTIRQFSDQKVTDDMVNQILDAARRAPTSSNAQTYSVVVVRNPETKKQLAVLAGNQSYVETCPVFFAFCADISRLDTACRMHEQELVKCFETTLVSSVDAALVGMTANTAAESFGLGAVMIGGMRNHPEDAAKLLGLPNGSYVVFGMCIGWPDEDKRPVQKPRLPRDLVVHYEQYDQSDPTEKLETYDKKLAAHYDALGNNQHPAAYTGPIAKRLSTARRTNLRPELERLGFKFE